MVNFEEELCKLILCSVTWNEKRRANVRNKKVISEIDLKDYCKLHVKKVFAWLDFVSQQSFC